MVPSPRSSRPHHARSDPFCTTCAQSRPVRSDMPDCRHAAALPDPGGRHRDPEHLQPAGLRPGSQRRAAGDPGRRTGQGRAVAGRGGPVGGIHRPDVLPDPRPDRPDPVRGAAARRPPKALTAPPSPPPLPPRPAEPGARGRCRRAGAIPARRREPSRRRSYRPAGPAGGLPRRTPGPDRQGGPRHARRGSGRPRPGRVPAHRRRRAAAPCRRTGRPSACAHRRAQPSPRCPTCPQPGHSVDISGQIGHHHQVSIAILPYRSQGSQEATVPTSSPTVHRPPTPNHAPGHRVGVLRGSAATLLCGTLALALGAAAAQTAASSTGPIGLDALVATPALGLGAAAAVVLAVGCGLLTVAALGRAFGRSLDGLDALAARLTPAMLRRAVAVTVSTGLGLAAATGVASASEPDLGWQVTTSSSASSTDAAPGGAASPARPEPSAQEQSDPAEAAVAVQSAATEQDVVEQVAAASPSPVLT